MRKKNYFHAYANDEICYTFSHTAKYTSSNCFLTGLVPAQMMV
jgi:hypothetical protein